MMPLIQYLGFTDAMIKTAKWISQYYMCTLIDALRLFLIDKKEYEQRSYMRLIGRKFRNVRIYGD